MWAHGEVGGKGTVSVGVRCFQRTEISYSIIDQIIKSEVRRRRTRTRTRIRTRRTRERRTTSTRSPRAKRRRARRTRTRRKTMSKKLLQKFLSMD